ncbi:unnamed protein product, partial [Lampetra planeri]
STHPRLQHGFIPEVAIRYPYPFATLVRPGTGKESKPVCDLCSHTAPTAHRAHHTAHITTPPRTPHTPPHHHHTTIHNHIPSHTTHSTPPRTAHTTHTTTPPHTAHTAYTTTHPAQSAHRSPPPPPALTQGFVHGGSLTLTLTRLGGGV